MTRVDRSRPWADGHDEEPSAPSRWAEERGDGWFDGLPDLPPEPVAPRPPVPRPPARRLAEANAAVLAEDPGRWQDLEGILGRVTRGGPPQGADILRLGRLYHACLADLGKVQKHDPTGRHASLLNRLLARAYLTIYRRPQVRLMEFVEFFLYRFPALVWRRIHFVVVAALVFAFATMIGFLCITNESKLIDLVIPKSLQERARHDIQRGQIGTTQPDDRRLTISSEIMFNNIRVSFLAFALGILFGLGTLYVLIINGMLLGGLASLYHGGGQALPFWALILPHGGIELSCCFIAGAAGLMIGYSIFSRTPYRRSAWMAREALDAVRLIAGTLPWFILAALIETYITPSSLPISTKFLLSGLFFAGFVAYFFIGLGGPMLREEPAPGFSADREPVGASAWPIGRPAVRAATASSPSGRPPAARN
jgi:uncharacterized membrane protein SpoIIM required for sporulation